MYRIRLSLFRVSLRGSSRQSVSLLSKKYDNIGLRRLKLGIKPHVYPQGNFVQFVIWVGFDVTFCWYKCNIYFTCVNLSQWWIFWPESAFLLLRYQETNCHSRGGQMDWVGFKMMSKCWHYVKWYESLSSFSPKCYLINSDFWNIVNPYSVEVF